MRRPRLTVGTRLMVILAMLAAFSTSSALLLQHRALAQDLGHAAQERLVSASRGADLLLAQHLGRMADRYTAISHTPEFRANLRTANTPTLSYYARQLVENQQAQAIAFLDSRGQRVAAAGAAKLVDAAVEAVTLSAHEDGVTRDCVVAPAAGSVLSSDGSDSSHSASSSRSRRAAPDYYVPCSYTASVQATVKGLDGKPFAVAAVPLSEGRRRIGTLIAFEPIRLETVRTWSILCGAEVSFVDSGAPSGDSSGAIVHDGPEIALHATLSLTRERETLTNARDNLLVAGLLAVIAAIAASVLLARQFVHPIREIRAATERVGRGDLGITIAIQREDELGDVARAFNATVATLRRSQTRLEVAQRLARFSDWDLDVETGIVEGSAEFTRIFSFGDSGPVALSSLLAKIHDQDRAALQLLLDQCGQEGRPFQVEVRARDEDGDEQILHLQGQRVHEEGQSARVQASVQDVTERKRFEEQIRLLAYDDSLTGIGNRRYFAQQLKTQLEKAQTQDLGLALLFIDLDRFKAVNDTLGHSAGDELLQAMSSRIVKTLRNEYESLRLSGSKEVTVARLGGDEFTVLLFGVTEYGVLERLASRLLEALAEPCQLQGQQVVVTGSIGISLSPHDGVAAEDLLRSSDTAMYHAKSDGRNRFRFYKPAMQRAAMERWRLENRLRRAIDREELRVYYQPRIRVETGQISHVEALLRWRDPELGAVSPQDFIAVAEESGLICGLGEWVIQQSIEQVCAWRKAGWKIGVSVNLSSFQLQPGLEWDIAAEFDRTGADPDWVEFEVTESAVLENEDVAIGVLQSLRSFGCRISLDDFGTGYSSLSHLARLPVTALKIDRSFVENIATDSDAAGLVEAIVATAKVLRLDVVAEGVETEIQRDLLAEMGCDEMQGFLFGHAVSAEALTQLLAESRDEPRRRKKKRRVPARD